jgi:hypothetical protein
MSTKKTPTTVKNEARKDGFNLLKNALVTALGEENIFVIGDSEIAYPIGNAPTGETIYATSSPTVKDYCERKTKTKTITAFDVEKAVNDYKKTIEDREEKARINAENKAKKIERDKKAREKAKAEKEKKEG